QRIAGVGLGAGKTGGVRELRGQRVRRRGAAAKRCRRQDQADAWKDLVCRQCRALIFWFQGPASALLTPASVAGQSLADSAVFGWNTVPRFGASPVQPVIPATISQPPAAGPAGFRRAAA